LKAIADHRLFGLIPINPIFRASIAIGQKAKPPAPVRAAGDFTILNQ
jgi:hypothetical protein